MRRAKKQNHDRLLPVTERRNAGMDETCRLRWGEGYAGDFDDVGIGPYNAERKKCGKNIGLYNAERRYMEWGA